MSLVPTGPNADMIAYWNDATGRRWVEHQETLDAQIEPLGGLAMQRAQLRAGERVVDVGCGCGQTSLALAEAVGAAGSVLGLDLSAAMLERARARAAGLAQLRFEQADAQTRDLAEERADLLFSRFGVMFFADPVAAFANLRGGLRPGGRLAFVCWQALDRNPWMLLPLRAAAQHLRLPAPPAPGAPGPFSFSDPERVRGILAAAGFSDVALEPVERELVLGGGAQLDDAVDFVLHLGPLAAALRQAGETATSLLPRVRQAVRDAVEPYADDDGLRMSSASWIATARNG